jgi:hypothetical protein
MNSVGFVGRVGSISTTAFRGYSKSFNPNVVACGTSVRGFASSAPKKRNDDKYMEVLRQQLKEIEAAGTYKRERIIISPQSAAIKVSSQGKELSVVNFW